MTALLFDANLSPHLVEKLNSVFVGSRHVFDCGDIRGDDRLIWEYAKANKFMIVSKDADFQRMSFVFGPPPKVVRLQVWNAGTIAIEQLLRQRFDDIARFAIDPTAALLIVAP